MFEENLFIKNKIINNSSFLVLGGAGSIGQEVVKILFRNSPKKLHVVDINENNLVELVRDIRSSFGYINGDFKVFAIDIGSYEYDKFIENDGKYEFVLNLSALKHVRSEKDPFTLIRLIDTNIFNVKKTLNHSILNGTKKYFSVSTDKAANPVNIMGASKRIMELFMLKESKKIDVTSARFANVLFSDGSLLYSFSQRFNKKQPIVAPNDISRFFISKENAAAICLYSALYGSNREIYFPKLNMEKDQISLKDQALTFLKNKSLEAIECKSEEEARNFKIDYPEGNKWPCYFSKSATTGEKHFEEFFSKKEDVNFKKHKSLGVIENNAYNDFSKIILFEREIQKFKKNKIWRRKDLIEIFKKTLNEFNHVEKNKFLDEKM